MICCPGPGSVILVNLATAPTIGRTMNRHRCSYRHLMGLVPRPVTARWETWQAPMIARDVQTKNLFYRTGNGTIAQLDFVASIVPDNLPGIRASRLIELG
jgi:hypothetical protein